MNAGTSTTGRASGSRHRTTVEGVFHDRTTLTRAVERLAEKSVPADSIRVFSRDGTGRERREIPVEDEPGALRGALIGAGVGAVVGLVIVIAVATGMFGSLGTDVLSIDGVLGAVRAMLAAAAAGVPLGALLGMGHWRGRKRIPEGHFERGTAVVEVTSDELSELARRTLEDAGAANVSTR